MNDDVYRKMRESSRSFLDVVWPACSSALGGGEVIPVECTGSEGWSDKLDILAGIDLWQVVGNGMGLRGIASRVQPVHRPWGTFTIRQTGKNGDDTVTEWQKRQYALVYRDEGVLSPHYTIHAYTRKDDGSLISASIVETNALVRYVLASFGRYGEPAVESMNPDGVGRRHNTQDGRVFIYARWSSMQQSGVDVKIVDGQLSFAVAR